MTGEQPALQRSLRHEFHTPVNHIIGYSEMLLDEAEESGQAYSIPDLQRICEAGKQLLALLHAWLDLTEARASQMELERMRHELRALLNAIIGYSEMLQDEAMDRGQAPFITDLQRIRAAATHLLALASDNLDVLNVEVATFEHAVEPSTQRGIQQAVGAVGQPELAASAPGSAGGPGSLLVVDDNEGNRDLLSRQLVRQGYTVTVAEDGRQALELIRAVPFDLVLLDILMPGMNGYQVLEQLKVDGILQHMPVIVLSALDELDSVVTCIELGAEDYLPTPFEPVLLRARISATLEKKRLRDQEVEYLRQVERLTQAAAAIEANTFNQESLAPLQARADALGNLARVFGRMAREVHAREQRLKQQLQQLRVDIEERQQAAAETVAAYIPMDRRQALLRGESLPEHTRGAALFADISGFTPLTEALAQELGLQRGAEEIIRHLNRVFGALIDEVHRYGGSVISFAGDAITCWFDADDGLRATASALAMQAAMGQFTTIATPVGTAITLTTKVTVVAGRVHRWLVGDPQTQLLEALAGQTVDELALGDQQARGGDVLVQAAIVEVAGGRFTVAEWRGEVASGNRFAVVTSLAEVVPDSHWPDVLSDGLTATQARPWLLQPVYERVCDGKSTFLAELRPVAMLFLGFHGIDYDTDAQAGTKLDRFVRWVQAVLAEYDGALLQLTIGDKGSYLCAVLGAPIAHEDDAVRAVAAALDLQSPPVDLQFIQDIRIGVAYGQMRAGTYGSAAQRTYGVPGDKTNLAARLMQAATGGILCDAAVAQAAQAHVHFEALPPITVKGKAQPVAIYRPVSHTIYSVINSRIDQLSAAQQLTLKVASVIGRVFAVSLLRQIYPTEADKTHLDAYLQALEEVGLIKRHPSDPPSELSYAFYDSLTWELAYNRLLFAQRRQLHRALAEWYERVYATDLAPYYRLLAHHWSKAEDPAKTIHYLERAGTLARQQGAYQEAAQYFHDSLALDVQSAVLSANYYSAGDSGEGPSLEDR